MKYSRVKYHIRGGANKNLSKNEKIIRLKIFNDVIHILEKEKIIYAIINGVDDYPYNLGRDIDVIIKKKDKKKVVAFIYKHYEKEKEYFVYSRKSGYGLYQLTIVKMIDRNNYVSVQFDFTYSDLNWIIGIFNPMPNKKTLETSIFTNGFRVSIWCNYIKTIRPLIYYHPENIKKKFKVYQEIVSGRFKEDFVNILGKSLFKEFEKSVNEGEKELIKWAKTNKRKFLLHKFFNNPLRSFYYLFLNFIRRIRIILYNRPPIIAVVGPDGVGKSSALKYTAQQLDKAGFDVRIKHWRPGLLPNPGYFWGKSDNDLSNNYPPTRKVSKFQFIRCLYYFCDFVLGHYLIDRYSPISEFHLVIYDRCALDMIVDPLRYGFNKKIYVKLLYKLTPRMDYIIYLHDDPIVIFNRKKELTVKEIEEQNIKLNILLKKGHINIKVKCGDRITKTANKLSLSILCFLKNYYKVNL
jgi:hypothetical protein